MQRHFVSRRPNMFHIVHRTNAQPSGQNYGVLTGGNSSGCRRLRKEPAIRFFSSSRSESGDHTGYSGKMVIGPELASMIGPEDFRGFTFMGMNTPCG